MRKKVFECGVSLVLFALVFGLAGCERAKPQPTPTKEVAPVSATQTPVAAPETSAVPSTTVEETATPAPPPETVAPTAEPAPVAAEGLEHVVRWGETVYTIADTYGVSAQDIVMANNLTNPDLIRAGDVLVIPGASAPSPQPGVHIVRRGETLNSIAQMYGTTVDVISRANGIVNPNYIWVGQSLTIPGGASAPSGGETYVVQQGDSLSSIAVRFGTTAWAIAYANNLPNVNIIYVGQTLKIP